VEAAAIEPDANNSEVHAGSAGAVAGARAGLLDADDLFKA
jgi:hypothetical protein